MTCIHTLSFSPKYLTSFSTLQKLFSAKEEFFTLNQLSQNEILQSKKNAQYSSRKICYVLLTAPYKMIFAIVVKAIAYFLFCFYPPYANQLFLFSNHLLKEFNNVLNLYLYGKRLLVSSINDYRQDLQDVYNLSSIKKEEVVDQKIRQSLHPKLKYLHFNRIGKGLCHGGVTWFNFLFLQSFENTSLQKRANSLEEYASSIALQFSEGHPRFAALIQTFYGLEKKFLEMEEVSYEIPPTKFHSQKLLSKKIKLLPDGVYYLAFSRHAVSFLKFKKQQLIWDPNSGLICINDSQDLFSVFEKYTRNLKQKSVFFVFQNVKIQKNNFINRIFSLVKLYAFPKRR